MRKLTFVIMCAVVTAASATKRAPEYLAARRQGALARFQVHVVDELGCSVTNADVSVFMGMNFRPQGHWIRGASDANGIFVVEGKTCGDEIELFVSKSGYYKSRKKFCFAAIGAERNVKDGKWQPFGEEERIVIRSVGHGAEVIECNMIFDVMQTNVWLGLDFRKKSLVDASRCDAQADAEVKVFWDGLPAWQSQSCSVEVCFPSSFSGGYYVANVMESEFPYPRMARADAPYAERRIAIVDRAGDPHTTKVPFSEESALVFRTRCVPSEDGSVVSANYGCIRRLEIGPSRRGIALLRLSYVFNPTPNDTNLEPKQVPMISP